MRVLIHPSLVCTRCSTTGQSRCSSSAAKTLALGTKMVLDHWAFGPHHVWSVPATGKTVRMWQPFNGLQVFTNGTDDDSKLDPHVFDDIPPALCKKKGGATFRIKCTDDGLPQKTPTVEETRARVAALPKNTN